MQDNDRNLREKMQTHLTSDLSERGYMTISSLKEYGPKSFENMMEEEVLNKFKNSGVDEVITVVLPDRQKERYYVSAELIIRLTPPYHHRFYGYYSTI